MDRPYIKMTYIYKQTLIGNKSRKYSFQFDIHVFTVQLVQGTEQRAMSSSSAFPSSPSVGNYSERPLQSVEESPFFKMAEEFKPKMVPTTCCKMSEDSQDSHQGQDSSHSRWRQADKSTAHILQISHEIIS